MTIYKIEDLTVSELKERLEDKINSLRELHMEMEEMYEIGFHEGADNVEMIIDSVLDDIREIENLLEVNHG